MEDIKQKKKSGVSIMFGPRQMIVTLATIVFFLLLPIGLFENKSEISKLIYSNQEVNPYSRESLSTREGSVQGLSTSRVDATDESSSVSFFNTSFNLSIADNTMPMLIIGVAMIAISVFLIMYLILGKFDAKS